MKKNTIKSNMYDWITDSFNPLGGACPHFCRYCYVKDFRFPALKNKYSGPPKLMGHEFKRNLGKGKFWFVGSCFDIFAEDVPEKWILKTLKYCQKFNDNQYLFQTKNPMRMFKLRKHIPLNYILGTTIETNRHYPEIMGESPHPANRATFMHHLHNEGYRTIVTIEPILVFDLPDLRNLINLCSPEWINIGGDSKKHNLPEPNVGKIKKLIDVLRNDGFEVKLKDNLGRLM